MDVKTKKDREVTNPLVGVDHVNVLIVGDLLRAVSIYIRDLDRIKGKGNQK